MKIYISTYGEPDVGIYSQHLTLDYPQLTEDNIDDILMTNTENKDTTEREFWRERLKECFEELFQYPVTIEFQDEIKRN